MTPRKEKIKEFFQGDKQYMIPVYQRAYSWEKSQWEVLLNDLKEGKKGENHYFFGNVLLEKSNDASINVIDGQQRITTIVIFIRALLNVLKTKKDRGELPDPYNEDDLRYMQEDYLIARSKSKLETVEYDRDYFRDIIIKNEQKHKPQTPSQKRICDAKGFFSKELDKLESKELMDIFEVIEKSEILSIFFENKRDAVLMFELQNNRGKDLTNMEKLKSYLAFQIYTYCGKEEVENKLREVTKVFEEIYRLLNNIKMNEDSILGYFNISKFGFDYRENDSEKNYKKELKAIKPEEKEKIAWIEEYVRDLKNAFVHFKEFINLENEHKDYLLDLDVWEIYPFVLKAYRLGLDAKQLKEVFRILEVAAFRYRIIRSGANFASRLDKVLKSFESAETLLESMRGVFSNETYYWRDDAIKDALLNLGRANIKYVHFLFMRYENDLRSQQIRTKGYLFKLNDLKEPQIEHIAPQTEANEVSSGYPNYDEDFKSKYLHRVGNLVLIDKSHNTSIGNKPFKEKLDSYINSPLKQLEEIKDFTKSGEWNRETIDERHRKIEEFVLKTWSL